jgi:hypothetical protein
MLVILSCSSLRMNKTDLTGWGNAFVLMVVGYA